jgi:L-threonylcarbamoyladenylate synthase
MMGSSIGWPILCCQVFLADHPSPRVTGLVASAIFEYVMRLSSRQPDGGQLIEISDNRSSRRGPGSMQPILLDPGLPRDDGISISRGALMSAQDDAVLDQAAALLRQGELVVVPTETVYGLGADAENPSAVAKIFALKGRPSSRPLIVHIHDAEQLDRWAREIPDYARALAAAFWPGPLSLVLKRDPRVPDAVTGGQDTVALRVPAHPLTRELLARFSGGIAAPSANRYGHISPTTPDHVREEFGAETPFVLDGGPAAGGIESTIVGCLEEGPRILRPGLVSAAAIADATGLPVIETPGGDPLPRTAGQDISHYAPRTPALLVARADRSDPVARVGYLGFQPPAIPVARDIRLPGDPAAAARVLYAALRELDAAGLDLILVQRPPPGVEWAAVRDRLERATAQHTAAPIAGE